MSLLRDDKMMVEPGVGALGPLRHKTRRKAVMHSLLRLHIDLSAFSRHMGKGSPQQVPAAVPARD